MKKYCPLLLTLLAALSFQTAIRAQSPGTNQAPAAYREEIAKWDAEHLAELVAPEGWLNLVGLYWLPEGSSSFGSGSQNKIVFPAGTISKQAGIFERTATAVRLVVLNGTDIRINGTPTKEAFVFNKDSADEQQPVMSSGDLRWIIIQRDDKIGIRLRELHGPNTKNFKGIERYPADTAWRITAILKANPQTISITDVLGQSSQVPIAGKLVFTIANHQYTLDALQEGDELFIIFGDETSGKTTYPSGRFLSAKVPGPDGRTIIDFNKAYNPPCAFTPFATCPLPPKQNILPVAVTAGEKNYSNH